MVSRVSEVKGLVKKGFENPESVFLEIRKMSENYDWEVREVAATALVEIGKKKPDEVVKKMTYWSEDGDSNIRRASCEGLRSIARKNPEKVLPVLENLRTDSNLYVKKSVASVLRNAGRKNPDFVLNLCRKWAKLKNGNTNWIITEGLKKLTKIHPIKTGKILKLLKEKKVK